MHASVSLRGPQPAGGSRPPAHLLWLVLAALAILAALLNHGSP